ncbi:MAG TPA: alpha-amylase family glycosyl hydrolase [Terracidiphilus sp.]|jgi:glycosidase|nr:alpha-amylase family glycosyl hydrolase [Terracidiphilus sp.]
MMEFHISRSARQRYQFPDTLFSWNGNVVFASMPACRAFAHRMNQVREADKHPELAVHAGSLYAMGLIDEASHVLMARYRQQFDSQLLADALAYFAAQVGPEQVDKLLLTFVEHFPGSTVVGGEQTPQQWLAGSTAGMTHREAALEEMLLLWTANHNPAFQPFAELFEDKPLAERTVYKQVTQQLPGYFATRPLVPIPGAGQVNFLDLLRRPALNAPTSLRDQLELLRSLWRPLIGDELDRYLMIAGEILHEEELAIWMQFNPAAAQTRAAAEEAARRRRERGEQQWPSVASTAEVITFGDPAHEYEKFSPDTAWMPTTVMMAKSTWVWLAQLSRFYGRHIRYLSEIPDEELATMARRGINTLWLIGIWERSRASKTIKLLCGNQDAVASAYSLFDYRIADDLGGEPAYIGLRDRAYRHGIRLASDMVPNHMGIDSPWVVEHPEWFMSRWESPYPAYSFNGPDLSADSRIEIKIDDHYYTQSDAAVVFQRRDKSTGEVRYIYHGNDGTSFPWNDTAQLDYLNAAVREHVIQTILHVARLFPVIRFDAAMTLAKRHFHRLWFPGPGSSGAIPSRAEYGMTQAEFDKNMPHEFWREVVDRVAAEVPGTLLLAEAFWLMEGYFVRTLGMHRVYNSAFMVMTRDEDNAKYRSVIKNTLEFDPDIMKRYVNFMSNPDERTAIDQYGKGDKAFGVSVMMATLPGLPMFGHGQIEGFTEKYGMEYQRPRYEENPDPWMVERHDREVAPLLKRRWLFAESYNFLLYDFFHDSGSVDESVFAYSNRVNDQCALVVYNNVYGQTRGTLRISAAYADKGSGRLRQRSLWEGLGLKDNSSILAFQDSVTGLHYLRRAQELAEQGLPLELHAYQCHVFLDWLELQPTAEKPWDRLCDSLAGRGVPSLEDALINLELRPVHEAVKALLDTALVNLLAENAEFPAAPRAPAARIGGKAQNAAFDRIWNTCAAMFIPALNAYVRLTGGLPQYHAVPPETLAPAFRKMLRDASRLPALEGIFPGKWPDSARRVLPTEHPQVPATALWGPVLAWCALEILAEGANESGATAAPSQARVALDLFDRLRLREPLAQGFHALGLDGERGWQAAARIKALLLIENDRTRPNASSSALDAQGREVPSSKPTAAHAQAAAEALVSEAASRAPHPASALLIPPDLWSDTDICWLTGAHIADDHTFLVREPYEELLWWLQLPALLHFAASPAPQPSQAEMIAASIHDALAAIEKAGYRLDALLEPELVDEEKSGTEAEALQSAGKTGKLGEPAPEDLRPQDPVIAKPVGPVNPDGPPEEF